MKKILAVCGMGIGSSLILKMNLSAVLQQLGKTEVTVEHCDLTTANGTPADLIVAAKDIAVSIKTTTPVLSLTNIMNREELKEKLTTFLG